MTEQEIHAIEKRAKKYMSYGFYGRACEDILKRRPSDGRLKMSKTRYWMCIIGPVDKAELPGGADSPFRNVVEEAFRKMFGREDTACWSGWGLTQKRMEEVQEVWNKEPEEPEWLSDDRLREIEANPSIDPPRLREDRLMAEELLELRAEIERWSSAFHTLKTDYPEVFTALWSTEEEGE